MKDKLSILHLIDSFFPGGSERMSVNFCNALSHDKNLNIHLCATRIGGDLEQNINKNVSFFILKKKSTFDFYAFYRLIKYIKKNNIKIIHAHSSSFFIALIVKLFVDVKIVWHIHYGKLIESKPNIFMKNLPKFIDYTIVVNTELYKWYLKEFNVSKLYVKYIHNFPSLEFNNKITDIPGYHDKRIMLVANIRKEKDFLTLAKAMNLLVKEFPEWSLIIVGKDYHDSYSKKLKDYIDSKSLFNNIFFLGQCSNIGNLLIQCQIGVISSKNEGLPVALLEYGLAKLAVVSTDVGECSNVLGKGKYGLIVEVENEIELYNALKKLILNKSLRKKYSLSFEKHVLREYSEKKISNDLKIIYQGLV